MTVETDHYGRTYKMVNEDGHVEYNWEVLKDMHAETKEMIKKLTPEQIDEVLIGFFQWYDDYKKGLKESR